MDIDAPTILVDFFTGKGHPILIILTIVQHLKEFIKTSREALIPILKKNNMYLCKIYYDQENTDQNSEHRGFWFHVDGVLGDVYTQFIELGH